MCKKKSGALCCLLPVLLAGTGCSNFVQGELEALFAPGATGNALAVLNSVLFENFARWLY